MMAERNGRMASTTGLGHAIALRYAAAQADLAVPDHISTKAERVAATPRCRCRKLGGKPATPRAVPPRCYGRIINFCAQPPHKGAPHAATHAATRAGVLGLTRTRVDTVAREPVAVTAICLGPLCLDIPPPPRMAPQNIQHAHHRPPAPHLRNSPHRPSACHPTGGVLRHCHLQPQ